MKTPSEKFTVTIEGPGIKVGQEVSADRASLIIFAALSDMPDSQARDYAGLIQSMEHLWGKKT